MKRIILGLAIVSQILLGEGNAQDVITKVTPYGGTTSIEVKDGEVCEILNMFGTVNVSSSPSNSNFQLSDIFGTISVGAGSNYRSLGQNFPIAGPIWILLEQGAVVSYRIRSNTSSSTSTPANAVVIPTDATGSVQIILESSTDLVTWTQANPGTYGASTAKRFFRIRAVNQ